MVLYYGDDTPKRAVHAEEGALSVKYQSNTEVNQVQKSLTDTLLEASHEADSRSRAKVF